MTPEQLLKYAIEFDLENGVRLQRRFQSEEKYRAVCFFGPAWFLHPKTEQWHICIEPGLEIKDFEMPLEEAFRLAMKVGKYNGVA